MIFRWAIGVQDTCTFSKYAPRKYLDFIRMSKTSILSFQKHFPDSTFCVFYNGRAKDFEYFKEIFHEVGPSLLKEVELHYCFDFYKNFKYHFEPESGVWWKWVPFRKDINQIEICVDTDVICFSKPSNLECLIEKYNLVVNTDPCLYFCEDVCGNFWNQKILEGRQPINSGLVSFGSGISFEKEYYDATQLVDYGHNRYTKFIDEQGCFNVGLYTSGLSVGLLDRSVNVYGNEILNCIDRGLNIETCHFISRTKNIFNKIEPFIFRKIHDNCYTLKDFYDHIYDIVYAYKDYRYSYYI